MNSSKIQFINCRVTVQGGAAGVAGAPAQLRAAPGHAGGREPVVTTRGQTEHKVILP